MNFLQQLFSESGLPATLVEAAKQIATAGSTLGQEVGNNLSDLIDHIIDTLIN